MILVCQRYVHSPETWEVYAEVATETEAMDELKSPPNPLMDGTLVKLVQGNKVIAFGAWYDGRCKIVPEFDQYAWRSKKYGFDWEEGYGSFEEISPTLMMQCCLVCLVDSDKILRALIGCASITPLGQNSAKFRHLSTQILSGLIIPAWASSGVSREPNGNLPRLVWHLGKAAYAAQIHDRMLFHEHVNQSMVRLRSYDSGLPFMRGITDGIALEISLIDLMKNIAADIR